ncbi:MAG: SDR family NAD(P)-dependent oxidoreductase [Rhizobiaceae bacterium]|jgi:NAD(P)-dependent dehydrogenase (short-subunit alcohol dehydrogenase family)|nr:SDR family NAD(P)-dependent oxidoreductase [Rhizobiaceae bacterium]
MNYRASPADGLAWVTGSSTGIGRALALDLARDGYTVVLTARSADKLESAKAEIEAAGGKAVIAAADVTDEAAMGALVLDIEAAHGPIALAVFNAGNYWPTDGTKLEIEAFRKTYDINVFGVLNGLVPLVERFKARGRGHLVIVSSVSGYAGLPKAAAYASSKAAMINMAECLKFDFDKMGLGIQLVNPGFIDTPLTEKNDFPMPFLMPVEKAARRMADGFKGQAFEITFPRRFTWMLKLTSKLPYQLYFWLIGRTTGASK